MKAIPKAPSGGLTALGMGRGNVSALFRRGILYVQMANFGGLRCETKQSAFLPPPAPVLLFCSAGDFGLERSKQSGRTRIRFSEVSRGCGGAESNAIGSPHSHSLSPLPQEYLCTNAFPRATSCFNVSHF